jgi:hypothetical protein
MSNTTMKVLPDQRITLKTKVEVDNANNLYSFIVKQKKRDFDHYQKRSKTLLKKKNYSGSKFMKDILMDFIEENERGNNHEY